jgi:hypothetical protein
VKHLLYVAGAPGSGKSSLVGAITAAARTTASNDAGFATLLHVGKERFVAEPGAERATFRGTDALPMNVLPKVIAWLRTAAPPLVLAEGDRLANERFLKAAMLAGFNVTLAVLEVDDKVCAARRARRARAAGLTPQSESWCKGRATHVRSLAQAMEARCAIRRLPGNLPVDALAQRLAYHPVVEALTA